MRVVIALFFAFLVSVLGFMAGMNSINYAVNEFLSGHRVVVNGTTPEKVQVNFRYWAVQADGPFREVIEREDEDDVTWDFDTKGVCVAGCGQRFEFKQKKQVWIFSLDPTRQLHFTLRECRLRGEFRHVLVCYDGQ